MNRRQTQKNLFPRAEQSYGGTLLRTRAGRSRGRPLSTRTTMHLVLKSSLARGPWSFSHGENPRRARAILERFAARYGVRLLSLACVGNHLHVHLRLSHRHTYRAFIRAATGALAMALSGASRWNRALPEGKRFFDYRPFTRVIASGRRAYLAMSDYVKVNQLEGSGWGRLQAEFRVRFERAAYDDRRAGFG